VYYDLTVGADPAARCSAPEGSAIIDLAGELRDFADTAALVQSLDLVISCDTAVANLAGALGTPVGVLLSEPCDGRGMVGEPPPRYPSATLFRQHNAGDWGRALADVAAAVAHLAGRAPVATLLSPDARATHTASRHREALCSPLAFRVRS
jgi:hypothetical protein